MTTLYATRPTTRSTTRPIPMDLYRDGDTYVVSADLPGIDPSSVDLDVDGQLLSIRAERAAIAGENLKFLTRERQSGSFLRQLNLGRNIDTEAIAASYDNGVLTVTIPVTEKAKARKISVVSASAEHSESTVSSDESVAA